MIVVGIVAGALVEKAKNGTIITSARIILIYIALSMIILVAR
jgi:hypothetical protein